MAEEITAVPAPERSSIAETGSITAHTARGNVHCITIVGQIEGHMELPAQNKTTKYEHLIPQIAAVEQAEDIDGLLVLLNTVSTEEQNTARQEVLQLRSRTALWSETARGTAASNRSPNDSVRSPFALCHGRCSRFAQSAASGSAGRMNEEAMPLLPSRCSSFCNLLRTGTPPCARRRMPELLNETIERTIQQASDNLHLIPANKKLASCRRASRTPSGTDTRRRCACASRRRSAASALR